MRQRRSLAPVALLLALAGASAVAAWDRGALADYQERRARAVSETGDGVVVLFGYGEEDVANAVIPFRQNEAFYYLAGWNQPGAMLMLVPKAGAAGQSATLGREVLYVPARDPAEERWTGPKLGPDAPDASARTGFDAVRPASQFQAELLAALRTFPKIYTELTPQPEAGEEAFVAESVARLKAMSPQATLHDLRPRLQSMRAIKSPAEIALIRKATELSMEGHLAAMKALRPGMWEYEIGALLKYEFERRGSEWPPYPPIVGSGFFSTVLHYNTNDRRMAAGDLVVIDAAGSYSGYASDLTRTLPVSGRFTPRQREIYEIVLGAQRAAIAAARPGVPLRRGEDSLHQIALDYINKSPGRDQQGRTLGRYFIHGLGHGVGLNVHDPMDYGAALAAGMVVTIEPGIYIPEENLGVRIEDVIVITPDGHEVLSARLPGEASEVERIMRGS